RLLGLVRRALRPLRRGRRVARRSAATAVADRSPLARDGGRRPRRPRGPGLARRPAPAHPPAAGAAGGSARRPHGRTPRPRGGRAARRRDEPVRPRLRPAVAARVAVAAAGARPSARVTRRRPPARLRRPGAPHLVVRVALRPRARRALVRRVAVLAPVCAG